MVLLGGEPGSGKSRLVREFAREVARDGALVLYGAGDAVARTPYGPFTQAFEHLARVVDPVELRSALGRGGGALTRLLPDLSASLGQPAEPANADPDTERHRLHTAVTDLLDDVGGRHRILLVIDDAQWADAPTLLLLRHLTHAAGGPVLLFATFREEEAGMPEALAQTLADLRRSDDVVRMRLAGLSGDEVIEFVERAGEGRSGTALPELADTISQLTDGNPFLVCELWRALMETNVLDVSGGVIRLTRPIATLGTPESVREVVSERLSRLASPTGVLSILRPRWGPSSSSTSSGAAPGWTRPSFAARLTRRSAAGSSRSCQSARWSTGSRTSWSAVRSTIGSPEYAAPSFICESEMP